jgi:uncharacterized protein (TIGR02996 family)
MHEDAFLRAIWDDPQDETLRLVSADQPEERGDATRAEFMRVVVSRTGDRLRKLRGDRPQWAATFDEFDCYPRRFIADHGGRTKAQFLQDGHPGQGPPRRVPA